MLDLAGDINSLSHFKRQTGNVMARLKKTGKPMVLTVNGKSELVVQDAASYQRMMELAEKAEMMAFLDESLADADAGRTVPALEALNALVRKYKLKTKRKK